MDNKAIALSLQTIALALRTIADSLVMVANQLTARSTLPTIPYHGEDLFVPAKPWEKPVPTITPRDGFNSNERPL